MTIVIYVPVIYKININKYISDKYLIKKKLAAFLILLNTYTHSGS